MIVPTSDRYRWVGRRTAAAGLMLSEVRHSPVAAAWRPLPVDWLPETEGRLTCDFPIFHPIVRCISRHAHAALSQHLTHGMEFLPLDGLEGMYVGMHCIRWLNAVDLNGVDQRQTSIHSTMFTPTLFEDVVEGHDVFGVPEMITKIFVSERVRRVVEKERLTGLEFHAVPLR